MKTLIRLLPVFLLIGTVAAQTVNITGTVKDSNGNVYVNGSGVVALVPSNQQWLFNGTNPVNSPVPIAQLSSTGQFSIQLINTSLISPASANPMWQFSFCSNAALTKTQICFTMTPMVLTSSQDITSQIQAQAAPLPTSGGNCITTVANLTSKCGSNPGTLATVTDGASASDCLIGGGTSSVTCIFQAGTGWIFAGSSASNPAFNQIGAGTNSNALLVAGSLAPVTLGTITATSLAAPYIDWNAVGGGAFIQNKPTLNIWSNLVAPIANLSLPLGVRTSTFTSGDFGPSPVTGITSYTTTSTSSTDTSFDLSVSVPVTSYHNPFITTVGNNQLFALCSTGGGSNPIGFVVVGIFTPSMTCPLLTQTPFSRFWDIVATSSHVDATFYEAANGYTANLVQMFAHTVAGTGFNFLVTCAGANNTGGTCTSPLDTIRGDGLFTAPSIVISGLTPSTSPICPNGTGGALTTTGCTGGGGGGFPIPVGIAGNLVAGTPTVSQEFLPPVDVRLFFTTPYPTYAQAQSQDFGAVLNAAFLAATASGTCVDVSGLNLLNAPNVTQLFASTNAWAGLLSNTYTPCVIGWNFLLTTGVTQVTPAGALAIRGGVPGGIGGTGMVIQPCNTNPTCNGSGGFTVPQFPTSAQCATNGGLNCRATGVPSSSAVTSYSTGTIGYTQNSTIVNGTGVTWTSSMIGGTLVSACPANTCVIGSTSGYTTGHIVNVVGSTITLEAGWTAPTVASGQQYIIFKPNTAVAFYDGGLGGSAQKSFTGHEIDNLTIDLNGISGVGLYTKGSQEGTVLNNYTCFIQFGGNTSPPYTAGGDCLAYDQTIREASNGNETFLGHWSVYGGRIGMGQNAGGSNAFGCSITGFSAMDGSVALSQANGPSVFELQAIIGGGGGHQFQDACYIDGISGMYIAGTHTESALNDHWNLGPNNPVYNINLNGLTSSGTLGNSVVEFHSGTSGNQIHGVSRPSGGILITDDNLATPTVATSVSGTPSSWTSTEYLQQGNAGVSLIASGNAVFTGAVTAQFYQWLGPVYITGPIPATPMSPTTSGNSAIGESSDGNYYISPNGGPIQEICTASNGACPGGGGGGTVGSSGVTNQSTSQTSTTIATTPAAGNYNLRYYADVNTACTTGANTVSFTMNWTDVAGAKVLTTGSMSMAVSSNSSYIGGEMPIRVASGNVTYTSTITGSCGTGTSSYDVHMVLTQ